MFLFDFVAPMDVKEAKATSQRLDAKCWKGKHKEGTKVKGGVRVNNCVPNESVTEDSWHGETDAWHAGDNSWSSENHEMVEGQQLNVGDPVVVTASNEFEGKTGEIAEFSPSGKFVVVNLYNHGKHSMHLSDVAYNDYADKEDDELDEGIHDNPVVGAIVNRIMRQRVDLLKQYGPELVGAAVDNVADYVGDVDEIGSSDVSAWVAQVERMLKENPPEAFAEGSLNEFAPSPEREDDEVPDQILKLANRWWNAGDKQPQITNVLRSLGWSIAQVESEDDAVQMQHNDGTTYFISADDFDPEVFEGFQDFNKVEPYAVCLAGKPVKKFDYYEQARKFHDNWKQKLYREGNKAKADKITLMPLNLDEGARGDAIKQGYQAAVKGLTKQQNPYYKSVNGQTPPEAYDWEAGWEDARDSGKIPQGVAEGGYVDPKIQFLQPTIQFAEKMGYKATLNPQGRVVAKLVNKQLGHIVHIGLMQPSGKGFEVSMADNLDKQTNAWSAKELAQDFKGWYAQAVKDQDFNNGYNEKPQLEQQGVAEDTDSWFRVTVKTPNGKNRNIQVPANSHGTAKRKALAYCAKNSIAGAEFVSAMRMPTLDEQGVAEGDDLTHAGQDVMVWTGPPTNNPPRDDKKYWVRGQLNSTEMHGGSMRANVMTAKGMYNPELSRVFNADMSEAYTPSPAKPFRNPPGFNKQGTGVGNKLAQQTRDELAKKKQPGVAEGHADQQRKIFKKNGEPVGEVGIDRESSPGNGQWYMKHYASGKDLAGYDSYEEAVEELKHCMKQGVAESSASGSYAYDKGYEDGVRGKEPNCPFAPNSPDYTQYKDGWNDGRDEFELNEGQTDYSKRRARERDVDAGKPVAKQRPSKMTDYQKRRAQQKKEMELGEGTNYWTKLQSERNTKLNTLVNELKESINK